MIVKARGAPIGRVAERRRAVALARHFRESEGLSIRQIADRLGRSPATIKAYFYDPSDANKGLSRERVAKAGGREVWCHLPDADHEEKCFPGGPFFARDWAARLGCPAPSVGLEF